MTEEDRHLDFIVIGAQKGGTTSLWQYLRHHPAIALPDYKETPIFCRAEEMVAPKLAWFMETNFDGLPSHVLLGNISTHYMMGMDSVDVGEIAERIARMVPSVRLIALLRDPIDRAISHHRMSVRRGFEQRSFDAVVTELLEPGLLAIGRTQPSETNSYLVQGEYGRILQTYRESFPAERMHVECSADLDRDPGFVIDRVLTFLGLGPGYRPEGLDIRHHRGGTRLRIDAEGEAQLRAFMETNVWPRLGNDAKNVGYAFDFFLQTWNVIPDDRRPPLSEPNRRRLQEHYRADGELLRTLGYDAPWLDG